MTSEWLFIGLIVIAGFLTWTARYTPQMLVRIAASLSWLALGVWILTGGVIGISENWAKILSFVPIIMAITPFLWQIRSDVTRRLSTQDKSRSETIQWTEWTTPPRPKPKTTEERQEEYRQRIRQAANRALGHHRK